MLESQKNKKILILAAHPDDETLGCGATISKLSAQGSEIQLLTFTDGVSARDKIEKNRNFVLEKCSEILGIKHFKFGDFPDNQMDTVSLLSVIKFIEKNTLFDPDIIFTHHNDCLNIDHSIINKATMTAFRPQTGKKQQIYGYYVPSSTDYNPYSNFNGNVYHDVTGYEENKIICLRQCYDGEMKKFPHSRSYENIENLMKVWGSEVGVKYAEKFNLIRMVC